MRRVHARDRRGQALAEFALILPIFLLLMMIVFDFGRGIYVYNGLSEAAREIARTSIVNDQLTLGASVPTQRTVTTQTALVPGLRVVSYSCLEFDGSASSDNPCTSGDLVKVTVASTYTPITLLGIGGSFDLTASSSLQVP